MGLIVTYGAVLDLAVWTWIASALLVTGLATAAVIAAGRHVICAIARANQYCNELDQPRKESQQP